MNSEAFPRAIRSLDPYLPRIGIVVLAYSIAVVATIVSVWGPFEDPIVLLINLALGLLLFPLGIAHAIDPTPDLPILFFSCGIYTSLGVSITVVRQRWFRVLLFLAFLSLLIINFAGCQPYGSGAMTYSIDLTSA